MLNKLLSKIRRPFNGDRRKHRRPNAERARVVNRQYEAALRLARSLGTTPEELLDYRKADRILGQRQ